MKRFNPSSLEPKWHKIWDDEQTYKANLSSDKPKYFAMSMFNYPSGNLHIGHAMNYTISDVMARYKRQQGYESYHPVGWDSFGLPAENRAIKEKVSPQASMAELIPSYHKAYKAMGWSNDWSKEIATHEPEYYKWTQWIFSEMYRAGLAYQEPRMQWWCTKCQTVLANEQVIDGKCWRHDGPDDLIVEKKEVMQWFFKITDYADEILEATDDLDWTESVKLAQKNWIGRSNGVVYKNKVRDTELELESFSAHFEAFTANTFVAIAPDHPFLENLLEGIDNEDDILTKANAMTLKRDKEGPSALGSIEGIFTGRYAVDNFGDEDLPIWITSYAIADYGTGIVLCSAHDERDFEFAKKYNIRLKPTMLPVDESEARKVQNLEYCFTDMTHGILIEPEQFSGRIAEECRDEIIDYLETNKLGYSKTSYKMRDWSVSRQRYWGAPIPIIHCQNCGPQLVPDDQLPIVLPELADFQPSGDGRSALARATDWLEIDCPKCGGKAERETDTLDTYICSSWYFLRYLDPENTEQMVGHSVAKKWMPVDFYNGADHATAHLLYARFVARFFYKTHGIGTAEPFKKFLFNGKITAQDGTMFSKSKGNGIDPLEIISSGYGADALRTYLMFAAPLDTWIRWDPQGVPGTHRFLNRIWNLTHEFIEIGATPGEHTVLKLIHPVIKKVTHDLEHQKYNTAIAAMMELTNKLYEVKAKEGFVDGSAWKFTLESLVSLVAPFAPHMADELWHEIGNDSSIQKDSWPKWDNKYLQSDSMMIIVQVNGKLRAKLEVSKDTSKEEIEKLALSDTSVQKHLDNKKPTKVIYVPGRLVNIVV